VRHALNFKTQSPTLEQTIGTMVCGGQTGTEPALWMAYQQILAISQPGALNVIVLFTDGNPNGYPAASFTIKRAADTRYDVSTPTNLVATPASTCNIATAVLPSGFVGECRNQFADSRAINVGDFAEIYQDHLLAPARQLT